MDTNKLKPEQLAKYNVFKDWELFAGCMLPRDYQLIRFESTQYSMSKLKDDIKLEYLQTDTTLPHLQNQSNPELYHKEAFICVCQLVS